MSSTAKWVIGTIGGMLIGILGSMAATALFDWRLPPWLHQQQPPVPPPANTPIDWWHIGWLVCAISGVVVIIVIVISSKPDNEPKVWDYK
jgi:hypothetical protein